MKEPLNSNWLSCSWNYVNWKKIYERFVTLGQGHAEHWADLAEKAMGVNSILPIWQYQTILNSIQSQSQHFNEWGLGSNFTTNKWHFQTKKNIFIKWIILHFNPAMP